MATHQNPFLFRTDSLSRVVWPIVGQALPHHSAIKKTPHRYGRRQIRSRNPSVEVPSSPRLDSRLESS